MMLIGGVNLTLVTFCAVAVGSGLDASGAILTLGSIVTSLIAMAVAATILLLTRRWNVVGQMFAYLLAFVVVQNVLLRVILPEDHGRRISVLLATTGLFSTLVGPSHALWRPAIGVGVPSVALSVPATDWFGDPRSRPWGSLLVGMTYTAFAMAVAFRNIWRHRRDWLSA